MNDLLVKNEEEMVLKDEFVNYIVDLKNKEAKIKEEINSFTEELLKEMEKQNVIKIDIPEILINYIAPSERETFDTKTFREEHEDLYDEYVKFSPVKSSLRIKVK